MIQYDTDSFDTVMTNSARARDFIFGMQLCIGNAEWAHK